MWSLLISLKKFWILGQRLTKKFVRRCTIASHQCHKRRYAVGLMFVTMGLCVMLGARIPVTSFPLISPNTQQRLPAVNEESSSGISRGAIAQSPSPQALLNQGRSLYEAGRLSEAVNSIQSALTLYRRQQNFLGEAMALSNLALVQEQQGDVPAATRSITVSLEILKDPERGDSREVDEGDRQSILAQSLNVQAQIQLAQGNPDAALNSLREAIALFDELGNEVGRTRSQIRQAQALQTLGFHRAAVATLEPLYETLRYESNSPVKVSTIRSLADAYYQVGNLNQAEVLMTESLALATRLNLTQAEAAAQLGLANTLRAQAAIARTLGQIQGASEKTAEALELYATLSVEAPTPLLQLQAQLNRLSLLLDTDQVPEAATQWQAAYRQLTTLPPSRAELYAQMNLAKSLMRLQKAKSTTQFTSPQIETAQIETAQIETALIEQELQQAQQQAGRLGDRRAEAFALGYLGELYETQYSITKDADQWYQAKQFTEEALFLSTQLDAQDISYQWHWQMGRLLASQNELEEAIAAYESAVRILDNLRVDLVTVNLDVQFSFQENVEPIHRELVDLLLKKDDRSPIQKPLSRPKAPLNLCNW